MFEDNSLDARSNLYDLYPEGEVHGVETFYSAEARQTDSYILKGDGQEIWEPRFTLHGFRYCQVTGLLEQAGVDTLEGCVIRSAVDSHGRFSCSNPLLNKIHHNVYWTLASSLQGMPQDAADRAERVAWLGGEPIWEDMIYNFDAACFYRKWLRDLADSQKTNGELPVVSPIRWRGSYDTYLRFPCWMSTYPHLAWAVYWNYDYERLVAEHYDGIKALVEFFRTQSQDNLLCFGLGDHMEPQDDGTCSHSPVRTPVPLSSTAYYYADVRILARMAGILDRCDDADHYADLADQIKAAFNEAFLDPNSNQYAGGSQAANALSLHFGLVSEDRVMEVMDNLVRDIMERQQGHLSTGMIGTNALVQALGRYGRSDVLYHLSTRTNFPGWGYMVENGATTLWESWDGNPEERLSYNMKVFGSIDKFFFKNLAGIRPIERGYRKIAVKPEVVGDLSFVEAEVDTVRGPVAVRWEREESTFALDLSIPANTRAQLCLPILGLERVEVSEGGKLFWRQGKLLRSPPGLKGGTETKDCLVFEIDSGSYRFKLSGSSKT